MNSSTVSYLGFETRSFSGVLGRISVLSKALTLSLGALLSTDCYAAEAQGPLVDKPAEEQVTTADQALDLPASCKQLKWLHPLAPSGNYILDVDGYGPLAPFIAWCDMCFDGGGWTLLLSSISNGPRYLPANTVLPNTEAYMPASLVRPLAHISSQVHIRSARNIDRSITSVAGSTPILNLRNLQYVNAGAIASDTLSNWTGPFATSTYLFNSCPVWGAYPGIFWACGNGGGLHLENANSRWIFNGTNEPMEVYVR